MIQVCHYSVHKQMYQSPNSASCVPGPQATYNPQRAAIPVPLFFFLTLTPHPPCYVRFFPIQKQ